MFIPAEGTIPKSLHMVFQMMFFIITSGVDLRGVCGADEVFGDGAVLRAVGDVRVLPGGRTGSVGRRLVLGV